MKSAFTAGDDLLIKCLFLELLRKSWQKKKKSDQQISDHLIHTPRHQF